MGHQTFEKLAFVASSRPKAKEALDELTAIYGNFDPNEADAISAFEHQQHSQMPWLYPNTNT